MKEKLFKIAQVEKEIKMFAMLGKLFYTNIWFPRPVN